MNIDYLMVPFPISHKKWKPKALRKKKLQIL